MTDYIRREALLEKAWDADTRIKYVQVVDVGDILAEPAADVSEVVRCRDCEYSVLHEDGEPYCIHRRGLNPETVDCFCSYGKRMGER